MSQRDGPARWSGVMNDGLMGNETEGDGSDVFLCPESTNEDPNKTNKETTTAHNPNTKEKHEQPNETRTTKRPNKTRQQPQMNPRREKKKRERSK